MCFLYVRWQISFFICSWLDLFLHAAFDFENAPRDINTEIVTKVVPVRAVNLSTGPFCTGFRCEQLCGDDIFRDRGQLLGPEIRPRDIDTEIVTKNRPCESCGPLGCTILHRISVRTFLPLLEKFQVGNPAIVVGKSCFFQMRWRLFF